jgi:hypothetical protein
MMRVNMPESPRDRIARHFGLGEYGKRLAEEILREYGEQIALYLEVGADRPEAAEDVRVFNNYDFE